MECSNKGICDRKAGECECFDGYEGSSCQRASCPNECSGHGTCEHIKTLAANDFDNTGLTAIATFQHPSNDPDPFEHAWFDGTSYLDDLCTEAVTVSSTDCQAYDPSSTSTWSWSEQGEELTSDGLTFTWEDYIAGLDGVASTGRVDTGLAGADLKDADLKGAT